MEERWESVVFPNRAYKLGSIEDSRDHRLALLDWNAQLTAFNNHLVGKRSSRNSYLADLYQILGLFFVFEGVVITSITQANSIKCHNSWFIFTLSTIVSIATLFACIQKVKKIGKADELYLRDAAISTSLYNCIEGLKEQGSDFNLVEGQPKLRNTYTHQADQSSNRLAFPDQVHRFWKTWVWSYAGAVILVLLAFSGVTLVAVHLIICDPQRIP